MGDRAVVGVKSSEGRVYLYTHWTGSKLPLLVRDVIAKGKRWDDAPYLARMVFSRMVEPDIQGETGYGICALPPGDVRLMLIDTINRMVSIKQHKWTFEEFIAAEPTQIMEEWE